MLRISNRITRHGLAFTAALALSVSPTLAANITWDGSSSGLWTDAANWTGVNTPPLATDVAVFDITGSGQPTVNINGNQTISSLTFSSASGFNGYNIAGGAGQTLTINQGNANIVSFINRTATISANVTISGTGTGDFVGSSSGLLTFTGTVNATKNISYNANTHLAVSSTGSFTTGNNFAINRNGSMTLDGSFVSTGTNVVLNGGGNAAINTAALILGDNASFTALEISAQSILTGGDSSKIQRTGNTGVFNINADMEFLTNTASGVTSDRTVVLKFDGTGGDFTFDASKNWHTHTSQGSSTTADVEIGSGRTVSVLGNFVADTDDSANASNLVLYGGGKLVIGTTTANTYAWNSGTISVTNATLIFKATDTATSPGALTVGTDGTLGGSGVINRVVNINADGTLAPGNSIGTLTINNTLTLDGSSTSDFEIDDVLDISDLVAGITTLTYGGTLNVTNLGDDSGYYDGQIFDLFDFASQSGTFAAVNLPTLPGGYSWKLFGSDLIDYSTGQIEIVGIIPEPASLALMLAGALLMTPFRGRGHRGDELAAA